MVRGASVSPKAARVDRDDVFGDGVNVAVRLECRARRNVRVESHAGGYSGGRRYSKMLQSSNSRTWHSPYGFIMSVLPKSDCRALRRAFLNKASIAV